MDSVSWLLDPMFYQDNVCFREVMICHPTKEKGECWELQDQKFMFS